MTTTWNELSAEGTPRRYAGELARQLAFTDQPVRLYHYRDRDQYEVDAVLESASGEVVACEVKRPRLYAPRTSGASSG